MLKVHNKDNNQYNQTFEQMRINKQSDGTNSSDIILPLSNSNHINQNDKASIGQQSVDVMQYHRHNLPSNFQFCSHV